MVTIDPDRILGVVLAGGRSSRMGDADKVLMPLGDKTLLQHAIDRLAPQVGVLAINTNRPSADISAVGIPSQITILADRVTGYAGPLAGIDAGLAHARQMGGYSHIATVAADTPFFPTDLVARLSDMVTDATPIALAQSNGNRHPTFGLWPVALANSLRDFLATSDTMKVMAWVKMHGFALADFGGGADSDPFFNINTPEDFHIAQSRITIGS